MKLTSIIMGSIMIVAGLFMAITGSILLWYVPAGYTQGVVICSLITVGGVVGALGGLLAVDQGIPVR